MVESQHSIDRLVEESERLRARLAEVSQDLELFAIQLVEASRDLRDLVDRRRCDGEGGDGGAGTRDGG